MLLWCHQKQCLGGGQNLHTRIKHHSVGAHMVLAADASAMLCCTVLYCRAAAAMGLACAFPGRLDSAMNDLQSVTPCRPHLLVVIVVVIAKHLGLEVNYTEI
mgnify:CR=1 FL=1